MVVETASQHWHHACPLAGLPYGRGVTVLAHGQAIAVFRVGAEDGEDAVHALANHDPAADSHADGLARGILVRRHGRWWVGSPVHGHTYDLRTGRSADDPHLGVAVHRVKVEAGEVFIGPRVTA